MEIFYQYTIGQINFETLGLLFQSDGRCRRYNQVGLY